MVRSMLVAPSETPRLLFADYTLLPGAFDELLRRSGGPRPELRRVAELLGERTPDAFARAQALAELALLNQGVTFSVYSDNRGTEKIFPFCLVPRIVSAAAFAHLERGLEQRLTRARALPRRRVRRAAHPRGRAHPPGSRAGRASSTWPALAGVRPPGGVRIHIAGVDLIRDHEGTFRVLEDNLRTPSGVSYVLENRLISKRVLPQVFDAARVHRVDHYPTRLAEALRSVSPGGPGSSVHRRGAHPRALQLGLLRAHLPRAHHGHRAGAGRGPLRRRRPGLRPHHARAAAGARDLPPHGRRLPRSRGLPARQHARRARPRCAPGRRATWRSPTRRATGSPTTRRSTRSCRR